jgi:hypothetical protein
MIRRNDVNVVPLYFHRLGDLQHRHGSFLLDYVREHTFVFRRKMHHHYERQAAFGIHVPEELLKHRHSAGRRPQTHHGRGLIRIAPFRCTVPSVLA